VGQGTLDAGMRPDWRTRSQLTTNNGLLGIEMGGFFAFVGGSVGGWIGWVVGAHIGLMTAYVLSVAGTAVGVFGGRRAASLLLD
jgi:hypothetical protein